ncbi:MAG TPA: hypothetical protein VHT00_01190 [Stellaceae bacterium]|jgi:hypothetical protein|nr:hypothetical protein [Stellaceae bacterium]
MIIVISFSTLVGLLVGYALIGSREPLSDKDREERFRRKYNW